MSIAAEDIARTGRTATAAQWGVAAVVMVGSAASAGIGFNALHEHWAVGVITGLGVDLALASGLIIGRRLRAVGVTTTWGKVLTWLTGAMTLSLNSGAAVVQRHYVLAVAHAFLPVLLVVLCEFGSESQLKLLSLQRDAEDAERAERDKQLAADRAESDRQQRERRDFERRRAGGELVTAEDVHRKAQALREQAELDAAEATRLREVAQRERATAEAEVTATRAATEKLAKQQRKTALGASSRSKRGGASPEVRRQWIREQRAAGHNPTGAEVDKQFGPPKSGWRLVKTVEEEISAAMDAELATLASRTVNN